MLRNRVRKHIFIGIVLLASLTLSANPAAAGNAKGDDGCVAGVVPAHFKKKWKFDDWNVWATEYGTCMALEQETLGYSEYHVWGFEQSPGSRLTMYFGSIENAQPQTEQLSWINGG